MDIIEIEDTSALSICDALLQCLKPNPVAFAADGASVMLGQKSGMATLFLIKYPDLIVLFCLNHRLELAVSDVIKDVTTVNHFQAFMDNLYCLYNQCRR